MLEIRDTSSSAIAGNYPRLRGLSSFDHPADERSGGESHGKCRRNGEHRVALDTLSCVNQEFFRRIAALFCGAPYYSDAILDRLGNSVRGARSLVR